MRCANSRHTGRLLNLDANPNVAADADSPVRVGTLVDERYIILGLLGEGAMGTVYRAFQRFFSREVALKVVDLARASPEERVELGARFLREVKLLAMVESRFVARVYDSGALPDGSLYYAMERVAGDSLDRVLLVEGRLPAPRVLALATELAEALSVVHSKGLVHRDVKPANLMLARSGDDALKLVDFGIARPQAHTHLQTVGANLTVEGAILGSFPYMAPEQLAAGTQRPQSTLGPWTDVYAAGVTLFELAVGRPPFPGPTAPAYVHQHLTSPVPRLLDHLDESPSVLRLDAVIRAALAKDPQQRPRDGAALLALLKAPGPATEAEPARSPVSAVRAPSGARSDADPAALRGISADRVLERVASIPPRPAPRITKGRVAMGLAIAFALADILWVTVFA